MVFLNFVKTFFVFLIGGVLCTSEDTPKHPKLFCALSVETAHRDVTHSSDLGQRCTDLVLVGALEQNSGCKGSNPLCILSPDKQDIFGSLKLMIANAKSKFPYLRVHLSTRMTTEVFPASVENWELGYTCLLLLSSLRDYRADGLALLHEVTQWYNEEEGYFYHKLSQVIREENKVRRTNPLVLSLIMPRSPTVINASSSLEAIVKERTQHFLLRHAAVEHLASPDLIQDPVLAEAEMVKAYRSAGYPLEKLVIGMATDILYRSDRDGPLSLQEKNVDKQKICKLRSTKSASSSPSDTFTLHRANQSSSNGHQWLVSLTETGVKDLVGVSKKLISGDLIHWTPDFDVECTSPGPHPLLAVAWQQLFKGHRMEQGNKGCSTITASLTMTISPPVLVARPGYLWPALVYQVYESYDNVKVICTARTATPHVQWKWYHAKSVPSSILLPLSGYQSGVTRSDQSGCTLYTHTSRITYRRPTDTSGSTRKVVCAVERSNKDGKDDKQRAVTGEAFVLLMFQNIDEDTIVFNSLREPERRPREATEDQVVTVTNVLTVGSIVLGVVVVVLVVDRMWDRTMCKRNRRVDTIDEVATRCRF